MLHPTSLQVLKSSFPFLFPSNDGKDGSDVGYKSKYVLVTQVQYKLMMRSSGGRINRFDNGNEENIMSPSRDGSGWYFCYSFIASMHR